ncbi:MAG: LytTR family transcriptional regulator [Clostridia bacterium]|nr:LytTR family transcriptional regulator [Clostridia bacterium]
MKCTIITDPNREEEVQIFVHQKNDLAQRIEALVLEDSREWIGFWEREAVRLRTEEIVYFIVEDGKVWARTTEGRFWIKERLYTVESLVGERFVKIHQSCLANIQQMKRFDTSIAGTLLVTFQNGDREYVSRRQLKTVKERIGITK